MCAGDNLGNVRGFLGNICVEVLWIFDVIWICPVMVNADLSYIMMHLLVSYELSVLW